MLFVRVRPPLRALTQPCPFQEARLSALATDRIPASVADCDRALELLRVLVRSGPVEARKIARIALDDVLDRRNELVLEASRMGAQS